MSRWLPSLLALAAAGVHARGLLRLGADIAAGSIQRELFGFGRARPWGQNDDVTVVTVRRTLA